MWMRVLYSYGWLYDHAAVMCRRKTGRCQHGRKHHSTKCVILAICTTILPSGNSVGRARPVQKESSYG